MEQHRKIEYRLKVFNDRYPDGQIASVHKTQEAAIADARLYQEDAERWHDSSAIFWVEETVTLTTIYTRQVWNSNQSQ